MQSFHLLTGKELCGSNAGANNSEVHNYMEHTTAPESRVHYIYM